MARTAALIRLTVKQHRFELYSMAVVLLVIGGVCVVLTAIVRRSIGLCPDPNDISAECRASLSLANWAFGTATLFRYVGFFASIVAGVFIGVPLVASEVERATAFLPWTLGRSRSRWLLERVVVVTAWITIVAIALGLALDGVQQIVTPRVPLDVSLADYGIRGWLIPARVLVGVMVGILSGALFGRALPGLLLGVFLTISVLFGTAWVGNTLNTAEAVVVTGDGDLFLESRLQDRTGAIVTFDEADARIPYGDPAFDAEFTYVEIGIPGVRSGEIVRREVAFHALAGLVALGLAVLVVDRRRPY